jgi:glutathione S-transferase
VQAEDRGMRRVASHGNRWGVCIAPRYCCGHAAGMAFRMPKKGELNPKTPAAVAMLRILGRASSINVRKVLWTCVELGMAYELQPWGSGFRDPHDPAFLALNPNALVPVIVDGDFVLWESNTICRYLAASRQQSDLLPTRPSQRARVEQWMDWQATQLNASWRYAFMSLVRRHPAYADRSAVETSVREWNQNMALLDQQLAQSGAFVVGHEFTLADVVLGLSTHRWFSTPMDRPVLPSVAAYYERLRQRAGFAIHGSNGIP